MSYAVWVAAVVTAGFFAADWWAAWHRRPDVERLAKPAAMVGLLSVALLAGATDTASGRWVVLALVLGLVGDVLLLEDTPSGSSAGWRRSSLGHLAYVAAFVTAGLDRPALGWLGAARAARRPRRGSPHPARRGRRAVGRGWVRPSRPTWW